MILVDSHCHLNGEHFFNEIEEVIGRARDAGVEYLLNVGSGDPASTIFEEAIATADQHQNIFAAIGVHPHDAIHFDSGVESRVVDLISKSGKVIALGEIGLDFYYNHSPREIQLEVFQKQIEMAFELKLPIIVHSRNADTETLEILNKAAKSPKFVGGIMHCFGGAPEVVPKLLDLGFLISFAGNVTFKKAENLRNAARLVPLDRILIETDCPYLTPEPLRGRRNEPAFVLHTASFLSSLFAVNLEDFARTTTRNFLRFFKLNNQ